MVDKKEIIRPCEFFNICEAACGGTLEDIELCSCYGIFKQLKRADKMHKEETFDCVHRYRKILSSSPLQGLVLSETEDICIPQNVSIPNKKGCSKQCKIYASRFIKGEKNV